MIERRLRHEIESRLEEQAAVCLLGPRQVGKTTLALEISESLQSVYLDLESPADASRLAEPELYLESQADKFVVIDEVQLAPGLFGVLRGVIDRGRQTGRSTGRFLLLGSAAPELLRQSGESLAGRVAYLELEPLMVDEVPSEEADRLWARGGFPLSFLAVDDRASVVWRQDFIRTYLERDVPQLGPRLPAETLRRFWTMLAHRQGSIFNASDLARSLDLSAPTVARYLDLMVDLLLVRRLEPWVSNAGKRLVKSPKVFVRDSGLVHALLGLGDLDALLGHPVAGPSWEGFVIENLISAAGDRASASFYRSSGGAEVDLILDWPGGPRWAIEVKRSLSPRVRRGFHSAAEDISPDRGFVVYPGEERYPVSGEVEAVGLRGLVADALAVADSR
jgi:predicted AAA+ superfamily ATPase